MKRRRAILYVVLIAVALVIVWVVIRRAWEPKYAGKSLRYWLERYARSGQEDGVDAIDLHYAWMGDESIAAMRAMGTNAVPCLLERALSPASNSIAKTIFYKAVSKLPRSWNLPEPENLELTRRAAFIALLHLRPPATLVLPQIQKTLADTNSTRRGDAIELCSRLQGDPEKIMAPLLQALTSADERLQYRAIFALENLGLKGSAAAPILVTLFHQRVTSNRGYWPIAGVLSGLGTNATPAIPDLQRLFLDESDFDAKAALAAAMCQIDEHQTEYLNFLVNFLKSETHTNRFADDIDRLAMLGTNGRPAIPVLLEKLNGDDVRISFHAAQALKSVGASAALYMPKMEGYLKSDNRWTRLEAASEILRLDPSNESAQSLILKTVKQTYDAWDLYTAINALIHAGAAGKRALGEAHQLLIRRINESVYPLSNLELSARHIDFMLKAEEAIEMAKGK